MTRKAVHQDQGAGVSVRLPGLKRRRDMDPADWERRHRAMLTLRAVFERYMGVLVRRRASFDVESRGDLTPPAGEDPRVKPGHGGAAVPLHPTWWRMGKIKQARCSSSRARAQPGGLARKEKRCIDIRNIASVEMSTMPDNFLVLHVRGEVAVRHLRPEDGGRHGAPQALRAAHGRKLAATSPTASTWPSASPCFAVLYTRSFSCPARNLRAPCTPRTSRRRPLAIMVNDTSELSAGYGADPRAGNKRLSAIGTRTWAAAAPPRARRRAGRCL